MLSATFSPDGSRIAFNSERDGEDEIYLMNLDGSSLTRLTNNSEFDGFRRSVQTEALLLLRSFRDSGNSGVNAENLRDERRWLKSNALDLQ